MNFPPSTRSDAGSNSRPKSEADAAETVEQRVGPLLPVVVMGFALVVIGGLVASFEISRDSVSTVPPDDVLLEVGPGESIGPITVSSDLVAVAVHANSLRGAENRYIVVSDDDGRTWTRRDSSSVRDPIGHLAVTGSIVAAVAASGGEVSYLTTSMDDSSPWTRVELPVGDISGTAIPSAITVDARGFWATGSIERSPGSVEFAVWTSPDGVHWGLEHTSPTQGELLVAEKLLSFDDVRVVLATSDDEAHVFRQPAADATWDWQSLPSIGTRFEADPLLNVSVEGALVDDGSVVSWWETNNGETEPSRVEKRLTRVVIDPSGVVTTEVLSNTAPAAVIRHRGRFLAHQWAGPGFNGWRLLTSDDGIDWVTESEGNGQIIGDLVETPGGAVIAHTVDAEQSAEVIRRLGP